MKKILTLTLALVMVLSLAGCYSARMLFVDGIKYTEVEGWAIAKDDDAPTDETTPDWGLTLEAKDVTNTGLTLVIHQEGGVELTGEINTGTPYALKMREGDTWVDVPMIRDDIAWNTVGYLVPTGGKLEQNLNWSWMYGELPAGEYLLVKEFMDFRGTGDYDTFSFSVAFAVE